ncbi:hypothetical protein [Bacillus sp. B15-48]|uniref:hypothetical protein n=1 Tax=Bacillus sp. B15-48 TaxID=1548601 RepID=UPI0019400B6B|nr:hypothetical protein [Bacillus sp. B15-48]MBM4765029.1 hypothetical protein [Bacillus sp. B15-48]
MIGKWLTVNVLTVLMILIWSHIQGYESNYVLLGKLLAQVAFILFLININMYFVFLLIRKSKIREVKVKLAKISKRMMKYHMPIAITATGLILLHTGIMTDAYWGTLITMKIFSGYLVFCDFSNFIIQFHTVWHLSFFLQYYPYLFITINF